ncbi:RNA polymerase II subunit A C-terminal domain phosphatase Fcp1 [Dermatophagoides pteronyssinus]|uniref:RNA polymerase II subunit A C-terminal domain phosphatase Fcp1 n=1 Tax=Dermatophagoides pteronyssinus TaxID=6956 RepID=UPI003F680D62
MRIKKEMSTTSKVFKYENSAAITILKWKVKPGFAVNQVPFVLFTYRENNVDEDNDRQQSSNAEQKYKITKSGIIIKKLLKQNGDCVEMNDHLFEYESCSHPTLMKDLCAVCGVNISKFDSVEQRKIAENTNVSMVHSIPELRVSKEIAEDLGRADEERLLKYRKLVLLVDLDQTIVHSTNQNIPKDLSAEIFHYQLYGTNSPWYHTKFRPYMNEFLEEISKYYELHICTFGARRYAHHIAHLIDPKCKFFPKDRILSRDEFFDPRSKTGNMKSLFPCGDSMVCIIDDRIDVWNYSPNVVQVKPYICFKTDDINAPEKLNIGFENQQSKIIDQEDKEINQKIDEQKEETNTSTKDVDEDNSSNPDDIIEEKKTLTESDEESKESVTNLKKESDEKNDSSENEFENLLDDHDDYLLYLKSILIKIHQKFYEEYDEKMKYRCEGEEILIPNLKKIIPSVRRTVLHSVNIVFSGVIATNMTPSSNRYYRLAESLGAIVTNDIIVNGSPKTTHLIAAKWGTVKVNKCLRYKHIKIVKPDWLIACADRWEKVDEELFALTKDTVYNVNEKTDIKKVHYESFREILNQSPSTSRESTPDSATMLDLSPLSNFSMNDLDDMGKEVEDACSDSSAESSNEEQDNDDDDNNKKMKKYFHKKINYMDDEEESMNDYACEGEYPKGWKDEKNEKRGCKRPAEVFDDDDDDGDDEDVEDERIDDELDLSDSSSSTQSIGSVDEEMAAALEKEFFNP